MQRLNKTLCQLGIASRRKAEVLIREKKVRVNGQIADQPQMLVDPHKDQILVNGQLVPSSTTLYYFMLNKPAGYLCSCQPLKNHTTLVIDLFDQIKARLFPVGRLDKETEGLLIVTNDGNFAQKVIHPSSNIEKEYHVETNAPITSMHLQKMQRGLWIENTFVQPKTVSLISSRKVKIVVMQGKKREVRKIIHHSGLEVTHLRRVRIGQLQLGSLPLGSFQAMTEQDKKDIFS